MSKLYMAHRGPVGGNVFVLPTDGPQYAIAPKIMDAQGNPRLYEWGTDADTVYPLATAIFADLNRGETPEKRDALFLLANHLRGLNYDRWIMSEMEVLDLIRPT